MGALWGRGSVGPVTVLLTLPLRPGIPGAQPGREHEVGAAEQG